MTRLAIFTAGLWRLRAPIGAWLDMEPVRIGLAAPHRLVRLGAVAGWGHKKSATLARAFARARGLPYIALEDALYRSVEPGRPSPPLGLVADRQGIYYDARGPSDLDRHIGECDAADEARAVRAIAAIRRLRLSKYNCGPALGLEEMGLDPAARARVLVVDQTRGDASIAGGQADADSFARMLDAACAENPDAEIVLKTHPDVLAGLKQGCLPLENLDPRIRVVARNVDPWSLIERADAVYTVTSGLGFEALLAGRRVVCFGMGFYAGRGLTDDRVPAPPGRARAGAERLFAAFNFRYAQYFCPYRAVPVAFEEAIERLAWLRDRFLDNRPRAVCVGFARWKRPVVDALLRGPDGPPVHEARAEAALARARAEGGRLVTWASRPRARLAQEARAAGIGMVNMEDGFLRSVGLGSGFVPAGSLIVDASGIYYDPTRPSDLETLLRESAFDEALLARARLLRERIVATGASKYNTGAAPPAIRAEGRPIVLVPGQVEDDASIRAGTRAVASNLALIEAARARWPDAYLIYKPHPDVEAGYRRGAVAPAALDALCDLVARNAAITPLIEACDRLETMTSLAGFEALLRGKAVAAHGRPFYAGWGLTEDLDPPERRGRVLERDALVAGALIVYPRYLDPVSGLPCPPEILLERLVERRARQTGLGPRLAAGARARLALARHRVLGPPMRLLRRREN